MIGVDFGNSEGSVFKNALCSTLNGCIRRMFPSVENVTGLRYLFMEVWRR